MCPDSKKEFALYSALPDARRKRLFRDPDFEITKKIDYDKGCFRLQVVAKNTTPAEVLFIGTKEYNKGQSAKKDIDVLRAALVTMMAKKPASLENITHRNKVIALRSPQTDAATFTERLHELVYPADNTSEGFHLVEHVLLRNVQEDTSYHCITVVAPAAWPRFAKNRTFFEQLIRREAPAHLGINFLWLSSEDLYAFEDAYLNWLYDLARLHGDDCQIEESGKALAHFIKGASSVPDPNPITSTTLKCTTDA